MELHQLEYFVAVAEEASFTRAASRVHVAQPGVSAQVRRLESELGQQLLDRSGRSVRLTEVGSAVLPFARAALDAVANARLAVDELAGLVRGQVTVGMVSGCALPILAELLAGFHDRYPGVAIALVEDNSDRLVERLRDGQLDLALIGWAGQTPADIDTVVLVDEELVAAVAPGHPLAAQRRPHDHDPPATRPAAGQPAPRHRRAGGARRRLRRRRVHAADRVRGQRPAHGGRAGRPGPGTGRSPGFDTERAWDSAHHRPAAPVPA